MKYSLVVLILTLLIGCSDDKNNTPKTIIILSQESDTTPPLFISPSSITINENQLEILQIKATDEHNITYSMIGKESALFDLNPYSGILRFKTSPDYEYKTVYQLLIIASDQLNSTEQNLTITLLNLNDNAPSIQIDDHFDVLENRQYVGSFTVNDADSSPLSLYLTGPDLTYFELNTSTSTIAFKTPPDFESNKHQYTINLVASDGKFKTDTPLQITLVNVPDVSTVLNNLSTTINENVPIGTYIAKVTIQTAGDSEISSYHLEGKYSSDFKIHSDGRLYTAKNIDFERRSEYNLTAYAIDASGQSNTISIIINIRDMKEQTVPVLIIIMNWINYSENDPTLWHNKFFDTKSNSVATWYRESSSGEVTLTPAKEKSGIEDDGVIIVNMNQFHPGDSDPTDFRDTYINNAIRSDTVSQAIDFSTYDLNKDTFISANELQFIFIVAGGEASYGDSTANSIWAHSWSFDSPSKPINGVSVMTYTGDTISNGSYARFGASQGDHKATIGIIVHEMGHALWNLLDLYDYDGSSSGLGFYDVMSGGAWARASNSEQDGQTPTQFSDFSKMTSTLENNITLVNTTEILTIKCSHKDIIKLPTADKNEYFLMSCRDSSKIDSDISFKEAYTPYSNGNSAFQNKLFMTLYHIDESKDSNGYIHSNDEDGVQTVTNHYIASLQEKEPSTLMTSTQWIDADFADVYTTGDTINTNELKQYNQVEIGYSIEVLSEDYLTRSMTFQITHYK